MCRLTNSATGKSGGEQQRSVGCSERCDCQIFSIELAACRLQVNCLNILQYQKLVLFILSFSCEICVKKEMKFNKNRSLILLKS